VLMVDYSCDLKDKGSWPLANWRYEIALQVKF